MGWLSVSVAIFQKMMSLVGQMQAGNSVSYDVAPVRLTQII